MISSLWNIRMRASRGKGRVQTARKTNLQSPIPEEHISGAETICYRRAIQQIVQAYIDRAMSHPRGKPDRIVITIEQLRKTRRSLQPYRS